MIERKDKISSLSYLSYLFFLNFIIRYIKNIPIINLGLSCGTQVLITAEGDDEQEAIKALSELVNNRFGEHQ